jgi:hypothetical protein
MNKRHFLGSAAMAAVLPASASAACAPGPVLLTITGALLRGNRGPFDPGRDIMMGKHKLDFKQAYTVDAIALAALARASIRPTLEYDARAHTLAGPLLLDVLAPAAGKLAGERKLVLRAVDGYAVTITAAQAAAQRVMLATHMDGQPMALGGLGPLWSVVDADRIAELKGKPLVERFADCPWGLYHIEVI